MSNLLFYLLVIIQIVSLWKIFEKAGVEGWKSIIPIYNAWVFAEIVGKPGWYGLLLFIPIINIVVILYLYYLLAKSFGKDILFALGLFFLPFIFFPILAFGDATYQGPPEDDLKKQLEN
jgi:hypothetical protein